LITIHPASAALSRHVINYLAYDFSGDGPHGPPIRAVVYPDTASIGCFIWGDPVRATNRRGAIGDSRSGISGFQTRRFEVEGGGRQGVVIARFTPFGVRCLLPCPPSDLVGVRVDYRDVFAPSAIETLEDQLHSLPTPAMRIACIERFLLAHLRADRVDALVESAARVLWRSGGQLPISMLAADHQLSVSALRRRFIQTVGVGPKRFARIVRLQQAFVRFRECRSWVDAAVSTGFYDQAHLIRECQDILVETPQGHVDLPPPRWGIRSSGPLGHLSTDQETDPGVGTFR
jgi:AraC-like DNA-binding protein